MSARIRACVKSGSARHAEFLAAAAGCAMAWAASGQCPTACPTAQQVQVCIDAGRADGFALPFDPVTPRPDFERFFCAGTCKAFDDASANFRFLHTFRGLPCGIVSASLEIRLRAECDISSNDTIHLQFNLGPNMFSWGRAIRDLPGAGGSWECPAAATITLNLAALPTAAGTLNLIPQLNSDHYLDLYVQDDTTVDYARLTLRICPCEGGYRAYTNGFGDNFAPVPTDPATSRQSRLNAVRDTPPFLWREPDECTPDRGYGQTFGPLPGGIASATLTMRMKACPVPPPDGGGVNDTLALELLAPGVALIPYSNANFYRAFQISTLTGGTWTAEQTARVSLNLGTTLTTGALACGSMIGPLADGWFDVYVQDDTAVDWATLRVWPCPPLTRFFGTAMAATGAVSLTASAAGELIASNLGAGENDGVLIDVHGADGYELELGAAMAEAPVGRTWTLAAHTQAPGDTSPTRVFSWRMAKHFPDGLWIDAPAAASGECARIALLNSETGYRVETCLPPGGWVMTTTEGQAWAGLGRNGDDKVAWLKMGFRAMSTSTGLMFAGDTIEAELPSALPIERLGMFWGDENGHSPFVERLRGGSVRVHPVNDAPVRIAAVGHAAIDTNPGAVVVSSLGVGGDDGVLLECVDSGSMTALIDGPCAGTVEDCLGSMNLQLSASGRFDGDKVPIVRGSALGNGAMRFDLGADFGPVDASQILIEVVEGETVTGSEVVENPAVVSALSSSPPNVWKIDAGHGGGGGGGGLSLLLKKEEGGRHTPFQNRGRLIGTGDGVRFTALNAAIRPEAVTEMRFTASGMAELLVRGVETTPPESGPGCFADFNQDGGIDGADVDAFYAAWEAGDPASDVNGDGGIDGADVEVFFAQWSAGGCG
ncbi:MAG: hypothetical protein JNK25_14865 [Phycisphaerae bacterium]|nr:hypothetical protein [Phycisphaerae bacterium]